MVGWKCFASDNKRAYSASRLTFSPFCRADYSIRGASRPPGALTIRKASNRLICTLFVWFEKA